MKDMKQEVAHLREKCDVLPTLKTELHDVKNRLRYQQMLLKNQKWEYSAPIPSGIDSDSTGFIHDIKEITCEMRSGMHEERGDGDICLSAPGVVYNEAFQPHWREFAIALKDFQYVLKCLPEATISSLTISGTELPTVIIDLLSRTLRSTDFKSLKLEGNSFGRDGIAFALNYIQNNPILEEFHLVNNRIDSKEMPRDFVKLSKIILPYTLLNLIIALVLDLMVTKRYVQLCQLVYTI